MRRWDDGELKHIDIHSRWLTCDPWKDLKFPTAPTEFQLPKQFFSGVAMFMVNVKQPARDALWCIHMYFSVYTCVYIYGNYTYSYTYSLFVCMVWLYMYIYIYIKPKLCSKKQCTHSCLARAVKCWSSAVPAAHGLTQANPTNYLYLEYIHDWLVVYLPLWKIFVSWDDYSKYMET